MSRARLHGFLFAGLTTALVATTGCGGGSSGSSITSSGGGGSSSPTANVQAITVSTGPTAGPPYNSPYVDGVFTSVTICVPGSTTSCQTIDGILVDTGSSGLRIMASQLTISLPQQMGAGGAPIAECLPFVDGVTWGPVQTVDLTIAGEVAKSLPIQVVGSSSFSNVPNGCLSYGVPEDTVGEFGANGVLGVGNFAQDCGGGCAQSGANNPGLYYTCPSQGCAITTESLTSQVQNPVALFPTDNNGVLIDLPSVTGAETSVSGSLIFGIGTQSDNALGSATVYALDPSFGNFNTTFNNVSYPDEAFLDTGSNGLYFPASNVAALVPCRDNTFWYCPSATQNLSAINQAFSGGATGSVNFVVGNADTLTANENNAAVNGLAGPNTGSFDWGLPFFFGRKVFTAIEGANTPAGAGPYVAY
ncbi:MAG: DUF3443 domain-containing protein [Candidatus Acidiferrum sp.]